MNVAPVSHRTLHLDGVEVFYQEAGPTGAPVGLLPHGYPCSSFELRNYMAALGDRWRLIAPDFPGSGRNPLFRPLARPSASLSGRGRTWR